MPTPVSITSIRTRDPLRRHPISTCPFGVYLIALETRFCRSRRNSRRSDRTASEDRHEHELQPLGARQRRKLDFKLAHQFVDAEIHDLRLHAAAVEPRNVEQRAEDFLDRFERGIDIADEPGIFARAMAVDQAGDVKPRRIERLQDVVARRGEKPRLGDVGVVRQRLGIGQFGIEPFEFPRAFAHAHFERRVCAFKRFGRFDARRHVGQRRYDAAAGHRIAAHFDNHVAVGEPL